MRRRLKEIVLALTAAMVLANVEIDVGAMSAVQYDAESDVIIYKGKRYIALESCSHGSLRVESKYNLQLNEVDEEEYSEADGHGHGHGERVAPGDPKFFFFLGMCIFLCIMSGLIAGLLVAYMSMDELFLEMKLKNGTDLEKKQAGVIMPIKEQHHLLLATLLLANSVTLEALPIFMDRLVPSWAAVLISTFVVVTIGEIIPQAICTGPQQIKIAYVCAPLIRGLMWLFYPICYWIGKALDWAVGEHEKTRYVKKDLKTLIELHQLDRHDDHGQMREGLTQDEIKMITSTIDLRDRLVREEMTSIEKVFMLSTTDKLTRDIVTRIARKAFSKIPVYEDNNKNKIVGVLKAKALVDVKESDYNKPISSFEKAFQKAIVVPQDLTMLDVLILFQKEKTAIAMISDGKKNQSSPNSRSGGKMFSSNEYEQVVGLISLKDVFEVIMKTELKDNDDHYVTLYSQDYTKKKNIRGHLENVREGIAACELTNVCS
eukprot:TRINITY_DN2662_c0_g1_i2.p1 TRINITY_DN2662_c0_g1~~TRINITY_DN2662_c0_g1_i2.p1  ORF type:complete len:488 (+),score=139.31 TRINITY_DN2662_c0_g1_i2:137-1600(+)